MLQKVILIGRLGRDPEMRYTGEGLAITNFSMAVNVYKKSENHTMWVKVSCFKKTAEAINEYAKKGMLVYVEGELVPDLETGNPKMWERKDGTTACAYEVTANIVRLLEKKRDDADEEVTEPAPAKAQEEMPWE